MTSTKVDGDLLLSRTDVSFLFSIIRCLAESQELNKHTS
jgi:hypothetical protein